jgi:hypothetical protein
MYKINKKNSKPKIFLFISKAFNGTMSNGIIITII